MAEYLLRHRLGRESRWTVRSAGTAAIDGIGATPAAIEAVDEFGIDMTGHKSAALTRQVAEQAAVIVVMTLGHREEVARRFPDLLERVSLMTAFGDGMGSTNIVDPIGMSADIYVIVRDEIDIALPGLIEHLKTLERA